MVWRSRVRDANPAVAASSIERGFVSPVVGPLGLGLLLVLATAQFTAIVARVLPSVVAADLQTAFGLGDAQFGLLHGPAFVSVYVIGLIASASIVDRVDRFRMMAACLVVWSVASLACAMATSFEALVVARVFVGLGQAAFGPCAISLITDRGGTGFARPLSVFSAGSSLGRSGALLLGGAVIAALGAISAQGLWPALDGLAQWRLVYAALSVPGLVLALVLVARRDPRRAMRAKGSGMRAASRWAWGQRAAVGPHLIAACAAILLTQAATAWIPSVFQRTLAFSPAEAALTTGVVVLIAAPLGHLSGGWLVDRLAQRGRSPGLVIIGGLLLAAGFGTLLGLARNPEIAVLAYGGLSVALGAAALAALAGLQPLVPAGLRGGVTALYLAAVSLVGLGLGPPLVGLISDEAFPSAEGLGQALASVIVVAAVIGGAAALMGLSAWRRLAHETGDETVDG